MQQRTHKKWTAEEEDYLAEHWGHSSVKALAEKLGRSEDAIVTRKDILGLGAFLDSGEYVTLHQLLQALGYGASDNYKLKSWIKNRGLPVRNKRVRNNSFRVVRIEDFWTWAEKNRSFIDFSKMEPLALGLEPDWVPEQRKKDYTAFAIQRKDPWTAGEDSRLIMLLKQHKYGYAELSEMLHRSAGAIQRRCINLGLKERPVKADNHGPGWSTEDLRTLAEGIRRGEGYVSIARKIGKSEKAVRGKVYDTYLTESADRVRAMLGSGEWGDGAPVPTVKVGRYISRTRQQVKKDLSMLDTLLRLRMNALGYDPYFQRFMCEHWDDVKGCGAGCENCDECTEFKRIRPQYCRRCGATFYERKTNDLCAACRTARKKQHYKKMMILNRRKIND